MTRGHRIQAGTCGVKPFKLTVIFDDLDSALAALDKLKAAGFDAELLDEADMYSAAAFLGVRHDEDHGPVSGIWEKIQTIVDPFDGWVDGWFGEDQGDCDEDEIPFVRGMA